jgi:hypothetical protein
MSDIKNVLETLDDLERMLCGLVNIVKDGIGIGDIIAFLKALQDVVDFCKELPFCLPEIKDLESKEVSILTARIYELAKNVIGAFKS